MVKDIVKDIDILSKKSETFKFGEDDALIQDLLDTANYHSGRCVGLAAVQIGVLKRAIVVLVNGKFVPMINPVITRYSRNTYITTEGCMSLDGTREVKRYKQITVTWLNQHKKAQTAHFIGYDAEIIQHEVDHLNGKLI